MNGTPLSILLADKKIVERRDQTMEAQILGLPAETWLIIGGLYLVATVLPTIIAIITWRRERKKADE